MAKRKPLPMVKLQVMVEPEVADAYKDLAELTGRSLSSLASEVLTDSVPAINKFARIIENLELDAVSGLRDLADMAFLAAQEAKQLGLELHEEAEERAS